MQKLIGIGLINQDLVSSFRKAAESNNAAIGQTAVRLFQQRQAYAVFSLDAEVLIGLKGIPAIQFAVLVMGQRKNGHGIAGRHPTDKFPLKIALQRQTGQQDQKNEKGRKQLMRPQLLPASFIHVF